MVGLGQKQFYKAFGLTISSDIYFSELEIISEKPEAIDIEIKIEDLTNQNFESSDEHVKLAFKDNQVLIQFTDIATFSIQDGKVIIVSPVKEADEDQIRLHILGTCMGAILIHRKILPLHGSTVVINGKAYAFIGDSGAGKSTLASAFLKQGFELLTDDVIAVTFSENNVPYVTPSYPQQKLWQESLGYFGMEKESYLPIYKRETKFVVPVETQYSSKAVPLVGVFEIVKTDNEKIEVLPIKNLMKIQTLLFHTYRNFIVEQLGLMGWHFTYSTRIIEKIQMYQLKRPSSGFTADKLVSLILNLINEEVKK